MLHQQLFKRTLPLATRLHPSLRHLTTTSPALKQTQYPPRITIPDSDIRHSFVLGSGPGGQVINKTASAAQLTHIPTGIVVKSQATRSRTQNYKIARQILADRVDEHYNGQQSRVAVKQAKKSQRKASADKKKRRKYKKLDDGKDAEDDNAQGEELNVGESSIGKVAEGAYKPTS